MENPDTPIILAPFDFQGQDIRLFEYGDELWFLASDVCRAVEVENVSKALLRLDPDEKRDLTLSDVTGRKQRQNVISEAGMYRLALTSRKPSAKPFQRWAANLIKKFRKGDLSLAEEVIARNGGRDQAGLERIAEQSVMFLEHPAAQHTARRIESIATRKAFAASLMRHSVSKAGVGRCTNNIYRGTLGGSAKELSARMGLAKKDNLRDFLSMSDLIGVTLAEALSAEKIDRDDVHGDLPCSNVCADTAAEIGKAISRARI